MAQVEMAERQVLKKLMVQKIIYSCTYRLKISICTLSTTLTLKATSHWEVFEESRKVNFHK